MTNKGFVNRELLFLLPISNRMSPESGEVQDTLSVLIRGVSYINKIPSEKSEGILLHEIKFDMVIICDYVDYIR